MPHLVALYTPNLEPELDVNALCRQLANVMLAARDEAGSSVFPPGGTRVLAFAASHFAVADDGSAARAAGRSGDHAFIYLNLRMASGRSAAAHQAVGDALLAATRQFVEPLLAKRLVGTTLQIDESTAQVYDGKFGNLHALFGKV